MGKGIEYYDGGMSDLEWIAESGAAIPAIGNRYDKRVLEIFWDRGISVRGCGGVSKAWFCVLMTPFSVAAELGVYSPGSLPLHPMKRIADKCSGQMLHHFRRTGMPYLEIWRGFRFYANRHQNIL